MGELLVVLGLPPRSSRLPVTRRSPNRTDRVGRSRRSSRISLRHHPLNKKRANRQVEMVEQRREEVEGEEEEGEVGEQVGEGEVEVGEGEGEVEGKGEEERKRVQEQQEAPRSGPMPCQR